MPAVATTGKIADVGWRKGSEGLRVRVPAQNGVDVAELGGQVRGIRRRDGAKGDPDQVVGAVAIVQGVVNFTDPVGVVGCRLGRGGYDIKIIRIHIADATHIVGIGFGGA